MQRLIPLDSRFFENALLVKNPYNKTILEMTVRADDLFCT